MNSRGKGIVLSYGYLIINMLCGVFLSSYLISELGDTEYGIYQTISSFANYLVMLEFGTGTIMTRNISMCRGSGESKLKINENISILPYLVVFLDNKLQNKQNCKYISGKRNTLSLTS
jgi:O-antigen/teichoic acid export membrane protein